MDRRGARGGEHLFIGHVTPDAIGDVVADGAREEERLLLDDADLAAQVASGVLRQWLAVQSDRPAGRLIKARQQVDQTGLARPGGAHQRDDLAGFAREADVTQHRRLAVVAEVHMVEADLAGRRPGRLHVAGVQRLAVLLDHLIDPVGGDQTLRHLDDQPAQVADRPDGPDHQPLVGHVGADADVAADGHGRGQVEAGDHLQAAEDVGRRPVGRVDQQQAAAAAVFLPVDRLELVALVLLAGKGFDHPHTAEVLLQRGRKDRFLLLVQLVGLADLAEEEERHDKDERDDDHREKRQLPVQQQDGGEVDHEKQHHTSDGSGLVGQKAADRVDVRRAALNQLAGGRLVVVGEGQALDVVVQVVAQPVDGAFRGARGPAAAEEGEPALQQRQPDEGQRYQRHGAGHVRHTQHVVDVAAQQQVSGSLGNRGKAQRNRRGDERRMEAGRQPPQAAQPVGRDRVFQVVIRTRNRDRQGTQPPWLIDETSVRRGYSSTICACAPEMGKQQSCWQIVHLASS